MHQQLCHIQSFKPHLSLIQCLVKHIFETDFFTLSVWYVLDTEKISIVCINLSKIVTNYTQTTQYAYECYVCHMLVQIQGVHMFLYLLTAALEKAKKH